MGKQCQTLFFWAPKSLQDGDCSHEIKRRLLLGRKVMTNLDSILKSTGMTRRDGTEREVGGGFRMGNMCMPMADSC